MIRFFVGEKNLKENTTITLSKEKHKKIKNVLRLKIGSIISLFNNSAFEYEGKILNIDKNETQILISKKRPVDKTSSLSITVAQALTKGKKFEWVLQKATELGVSSMIPLLTERSIIPKVSQNKKSRWMKIVQESSQQCGRSEVPELKNEMSLVQFFKQLPADITKIILVEPAHGSFAGRGMTEDKGKEFVILSGPEGGFTPLELNQAQENGFIPLTLGHLTLRSETAPLVLISILQHRYGDFKF